MKRIFSVALLSFILSMITNAQTKQENAVAAAVEQLHKAMVDADPEMLERLVAEKLSYGHSGGAIDNRTQFVDKIVSGQSDFVSIELSEQSISISGKNAIVRHILKAKTNDGGKPGEVNLRILLVWQKQSGKWKLLARQAVRI